MFQRAGLAIIGAGSLHGTTRLWWTRLWWRRLIAHSAKGA